MKVNPLKYNSYSASITPLEPILMSGISNRTITNTGVDGDLEVNIISFKQNESCVFLITIDVIFVSDWFKEQLIAAILSKTGKKIEEAAIFISASHTHYSSILNNSSNILFKPNTAFTEKAINVTVDGVIYLLSAEMKEVRLRYYDYKTANTISRRRIVWERSGLCLKKKCIIGPNPLANINNKFKIIGIESLSGERIGWMFNMACHPSNFYDRNILTPNYIGKLRTCLRSVSGAKATVAFFQGFAGDISPKIIPRDNTVLDKLLAHMKIPVRFYPFTRDQYDYWIKSLISSVNVCLNTSDGALIEEIDLKYNLTKEPLSAVVSGDSHSKKIISFQEIKIGGNFRITGIAAEPVSKHDELLKELNQSSYYFACGYINTVHCYLPTDDMLKEGGYEVVGFFPLFGLTGALKPGINNFLEKAFKRVRIT